MRVIPRNREDTEKLSTEPAPRLFHIRLRVLIVGLAGLLFNKGISSSRFLEVFTLVVLTVRFLFGHPLY